ncbi:T9SS type A sorting domain-containing protein [Aquimarina hainanensis]|uniref:T9SS type A sorting domain-containing protein n=1 Tax=Aquimarina hainanensis TaxID=1578017 RepID=A0ABW5N878_9FLAO
MKHFKVWGLLCIALFMVHTIDAQEEQPELLSCDKKIEILKKIFYKVDQYPVEYTNEMLEWITPCITDSNPEALYMAGVLTLRKGDWESKRNGNRMLVKSSNAGYGAATFKLAMLCLSEQTPTEYIDNRCLSNYVHKLYTQSYDKDLANYLMGYIYMKGFFDNRSKAKYRSAKRFYSASNHPMAKHWLAIMDFNGYGLIEPDPQKGLQLLSENPILNSQTLFHYLSNTNNSFEQLSAEEYNVILHGEIGKHPILADPNFDKLDMSFTGKLVEFDWGKRYVKRNIPISFTINIEDTPNFEKNTSYQFSIEGKTISGQAVCRGNRFMFTDPIVFELKRLFKDHPDKGSLTYIISQIRVKQDLINNKKVWVAELETANIKDLREKTPPIRLLLEEKAPSLTRAVSTIDTNTSKEGSVINKDFAVITPNPIEDDFTLRYTLKEAATVTVAVYDIFGTKKITLPSKQLKANTTDQIHIDSSELTAGYYIVQIDINGIPYTKTVAKQ